MTGCPITTFKRTFCCTCIRAVSERKHWLSQKSCCAWLTSVPMEAREEGQRQSKATKARREQEMVDCNTFARRKRKSQARWPMAAQEREDKNAGMGSESRALWSLSLWIIPFHRLIFCRRHPQREREADTQTSCCSGRRCALVELTVNIQDRHSIVPDNLLGTVFSLAAQKWNFLFAFGIKFNLKWLCSCAVLLL